MLYQREFYAKEELPEQIELYLQEINSPKHGDLDYIQEKYKKTIECLEEIDDMIEGVSEGWKLKRMAKVDLTIMRLAVYEMKYDEEIPVSVAINEAVEIAKKYGQDSSPSFINGILAKIAYMIEKG